MLRRLPILPLLLGGIAAVVVWFWPARPMWRSGPEAGWVQAISADGKVLVTTHEQTYCDPQMMRWDIETGELLSKAALRCEIPKSMRIARVSADGKFALVGEGKQIDKNFTLNFVTGNIYLHDGISGRRLTGPIPGVALANPEPFSLCGRWFRAFEGEPDGGIENLRDEAVFSIKTGEFVTRPQVKPGQRAEILFAPDGNTAALIWHPKSSSAKAPKEPMRAVQIIELPSGRALREVTLGPHDWVIIDDWDGNRLTARTKTAGGDGRVWRKTIFDFTQNPVREEPHNPLLDSLLDSDRHAWEGRDWIAHMTFPPRPALAEKTWSRWFHEVTDWFGFTSPMQGPRADVRILDRHTGATRWQSPRPLNITVRLTPDGRRIACHAPTDDSRVEVWDADPAPRWLLALLAGVGTTGVLSVRRWKRKDAPKKEHPSLG